MVVYEAVTREHYEKIEEFVAKQPPDYEMLKVWAFACKGKTVWELKRERKGLRVYVAEDDDGNIRAVMMKQIVPYEIEGEVVQVAKSGGYLMDAEDFRARNWTYTLQFRQITKQHYLEGIKFAIYAIPTSFVENGMADEEPLRIGKIIGDSAEVIETIETPAGRFTLVKWDYEKFLSSKGLI